MSKVQQDECPTCRGLFDVDDQDCFLNHVIGRNGQPCTCFWDAGEHYRDMECAVPSLPIGEALETAFRWRPGDPVYTSNSAVTR
jgi:Zn-finger nucleic acid-binding protein